VESGSAKHCLSPCGLSGGGGSGGAWRKRRQRESATNYYLCAVQLMNVMMDLSF
jgi:hypothetical protein